MMVFWKRECRSYFQSPVGYAFIAGMLCIIGANTFFICISNRAPAFEHALSASALAFLLMVPILTMRTFSEERRDGVLQFLYSMPIRLGSLVLGKYFALLTVLMAPLLFSAAYPLLLSRFGTLNFRIIAGAYLGFFAMGAALLAIGLFFSALLENHVAAAALTFVVLLAGYVMPMLSGAVSVGAFFSFLTLVAAALLLALLWFLLTKSSVGALSLALVLCVPLCLIYRFAPTSLDGAVNAMMQGLSVYARFYPFGEGILDLTALVYDASLAALMLFLTTQLLEYRRCR